MALPPELPAVSFRQSRVSEAQPFWPGTSPAASWADDIKRKQSSVERIGGGRCIFWRATGIE